MGRGVGSGRGRPKGSKNRNPYPITEAVLRARRASQPAANAARVAGMTISTQSYAGAHKLARRVLPRVCARTDWSCKGRLEVAFNHDADRQLVSVREDGAPYFTGRTEDGYMRLCASHHTRYDKRKP